MKKFLPALLLVVTSGLIQAAIIESISFDLSSLHAGSTLSGTFDLSNTPMVGDTASVLLSFSDPGDYSVPSLNGTIVIGSGTGEPYAVTFDTLTFLNPSGNMFTKNVNLMPSGQAQCAAFPCSATGGFEDNNPAAFKATYAVTAAPEPGYGLIVPVLLVGIVIMRRIIKVG
jgi:hypothetical protein